MPSSNIHAHELTKQTTNANISLKCTIEEEGGRYKRISKAISQRMQEHEEPNTIS